MRVECISGVKYKSIDVNIHPKCIILDLDNERKLIEFVNYKTLLDICSRYLNDNELNRIKNYMRWNNLIIERMMKEDKPGQQLSMF